MKPLAIVGAGAGGLSAALLAQTHGIQTTLFEAHAIPGGCASWFNRGPFSFDAGATTLSGLGANRPLEKWRSLTRAPLIARAVDPGIVFHLEDQVFYRFKGHERWMSELSRIFPRQSHEAFWIELNRLSEAAWAFLPQLKLFPPQDLRDLQELPRWLQGFSLAPYLLQSLTTLERRHQVSDPRFTRWMNALCMISAQNHAEQIPALIGALALTYPQETYIPIGGMQGLMSGWLEHFKAAGGEFIPRRKIHSLDELTDYQSLVFNNTGWSLSQMLGETSRLPEEAWSAFTLYAAVQFESPMPHPYHLVMPARDEGVEDYFVSFSLPDDRARAPEGWQTVTLSIHTTWQEWEGEVKDKKQRMLEKLWKHFQKTFPGIQNTKFLQAGTPHTFERYTLRPQGKVGGLPHRWSYPLWRWPSSKRGENLYQLGDTVFPGQGIVACATGAMQWYSAFEADLKRRR